MEALRRPPHNVDCPATNMRHPYRATRWAGLHVAYFYRLVSGAVRRRHPKPEQMTEKAVVPKKDEKTEVKSFSKKQRAAKRKKAI